MSMMGLEDAMPKHRNTEDTALCNFERGTPQHMAENRDADMVAAYFSVWAGSGSCLPASGCGDDILASRPPYLCVSTNNDRTPRHDGEE